MSAYPIVRIGRQGWQFSLLKGCYRATGATSLFSRIEAKEGFDLTLLIRRHLIERHVDNALD